MTPSAAEGTACCVCGTPEARPWRTAPDNLLGTPELFTAIRCVRCGTARLSPRPSFEEMSLHYTPLTYARAEGQDESSELGKRLHAIFDRQASRFTRFASTPGKLLDAGCGDGRFLAEMARRGWTGEGIETDSVAAGLARRRSGMEIWEMPLEDAPIVPASFDAVSFLHVLEHVPDPRNALRAARNAMRPGGRLLIAVPNIASLGASLFGRYWYHLDLPRHFWGFTPGSLIQLVTECGFEPEAMRFLPFLFVPQSVRNVVRGLRGTPAAGPAAEPAPRAAAPESGLQTAIFLSLLAASEAAGRFFPGEIMELTAVAGSEALETAG